MNHRLLKQITSSDCSEEEVKELFSDLQFIYDNPFDKVLTEALIRGCNYIEQEQVRPN